MNLIRSLWALQPIRCRAMSVDVARIRAALGAVRVQSSDFDLNPPHVLQTGRARQPAAVLIGLWDRPGGATVILTKRARHLLHHPGQIAFPGGKVDQSDADHQACALREAFEEIGLPPSLVQIMGCLPAHETVTGFQITPVLGHIRADFTPVMQSAEVEEVFTVPLQHVFNLANYRIERRLWRGGWRHFYAVPYGPYYIWGATARILRGLAERMAQ